MYIQWAIQCDSKWISLGNNARWVAAAPCRELSRSLNPYSPGVFIESMHAFTTVSSSTYSVRESTSLTTNLLNQTCSCHQLHRFFTKYSENVTVDNYIFFYRITTLLFNLSVFLAWNYRDHLVETHQKFAKYNLRMHSRLYYQPPSSSVNRLVLSRIFWIRCGLDTKLSKYNVRN